ncbi:ferredoxin reductase [Chitinimonas sp. BJYL2]|uniref:ferredoxin reductase n=1 Tax=Chitinimonas sp. BJYL2 TaxID=2976696 RepID=UPI0022B3B38D|nr:ferredoxin reductase [Chitinimonas sp. BJYL2]
MRLLPDFFVNTLLPRVSVLRGWLREDIFDYYGRLLHPQLQLQRVFARVVAKRLEGDSTVVLTLAPSRHWRGMQAGQHVPLTVEVGGIRHTRYYSPMQQTNGLIEIGAKRQADGLVSNWLHAQLQVGQYIELGQASGAFTLSSPTPTKLLMLAAGSGITPLLAMLRGLQAKGQASDAVLVYYARHRRELAFIDELRALPGLAVHVCLTGEAPLAGEHAGRISADQLQALVPDAAQRHAYACGSFGFTQAVAAIAAQGGVASLAQESFSPPVWNETDAATVELTFTRSGQQVSGQTGLDLLSQAEANGLQPAFGCRMGICNTCTCHKREGAVRDLRTGQISLEPDETIRLCISAPVGPVVLDL